MKNIRTLLLFLAIFALIFAFLNIKITPSAKVVFKCDDNDISKITLKTPQTSDDVFLEAYTQSPQGDWLIRSGDIRLFADRQAIQKLRQLLCHMTYTEKLENLTPETLASFGINQPRREMILENKKTALTLTLKVGNDTPTATEFYIQNSQEPNAIYIVSNQFLTELMIQIPDLMERHIWDRTKEEGTAALPITISRGDQSFDLPESLRDVLRAQVLTNYHGPLTQEMTLEYGMSLPDFSLIWKKSDGSTTSYDLAFFAEHYYARIKIGSSYYVLILDPTSANALWTKISALQN